MLYGARLFFTNDICTNSEIIVNIVHLAQLYSGDGASSVPEDVIMIIIIHSGLKPK